MSENIIYKPKERLKNHPVQLKELIRTCIAEVLQEYSAGCGYSSSPNQFHGTGGGGLSPMMEGDYCGIMKGTDYAAVNGISYHLKEEGCDTKMSYDKGNHRLLVRRDHMPKMFEVLSASEDGVESEIAERLKSTHFKNK